MLIWVSQCGETKGEQWTGKLAILQYNFQPCPKLALLLHLLLRAWKKAWTTPRLPRSPAPIPTAVWSPLPGKERATEVSMALGLPLLPVSHSNVGKSWCLRILLGMDTCLYSGFGLSWEFPRIQDVSLPPTPVCLESGIRSQLYFWGLYQSIMFFSLLVVPGKL